MAQIALSINCSKTCKIVGFPRPREPSLQKSQNGFIPYRQKVGPILQSSEPHAKHNVATERFRLAENDSTGRDLHDSETLSLRLLRKLRQKFACGPEGRRRGGWPEGLCARRAPRQKGRPDVLTEGRVPTRPDRTGVAIPTH